VFISYRWRGSSKVYEWEVLSKIKENICLFRYLNVNLFKKNYYVPSHDV
jgi:hypothetical protein